MGMRVPCQINFLASEAAGSDLEEHVLQDAAQLHETLFISFAFAPADLWLRQRLCFLRLVKIDTFEGIMDEPGQQV